MCKDPAKETRIFLSLLLTSKILYKNNLLVALIHNPIQFRFTTAYDQDLFLAENNGELADSGGVGSFREK